MRSGGSAIVVPASIMNSRRRAVEGALVLNRRVSEPFTPAGEGAGFGLSLSHGIVVKRHGGSIAAT